MPNACANASFVMRTRPSTVTLSTVPDCARTVRAASASRPTAIPVLTLRRLIRSSSLHPLPPFRLPGRARATGRLEKARHSTAGGTPPPPAGRTVLRPRRARAKWLRRRGLQRRPEAGLVPVHEDLDRGTQSDRALDQRLGERVFDVPLDRAAE